MNRSIAPTGEFLGCPDSPAVSLFSGLHGVVDESYIQEKRVNRSRLTNRLERL